MVSVDRVLELMSIDCPKTTCIVYRYGSKILVGKRNDDKKWTFPGGHLEENELPYEAAKRELFEEAGLYVGNKFIMKDAQHTVKPSGKEVCVFVFETFSNGFQIPVRAFDPDEEVSEWKWVELNKNTPELQPINQHVSKNNLVLKYLFG